MRRTSSRSDDGRLIWPFLIGVNRAKYNLIPGDRVTGKEAVAMGLANFYVETTEELMRKAMAIAQRLAASAPQAIAASKMTVNAYLRSVSSIIMPMCLKYEQVTLASEDHREVVLAFHEKRASKFTGR